jgi:uncharacterized protein YjbI with pentapeptide repeats
VTEIPADKNHEGADLTGAIFSDRDLSGVNFWHAHLQGADFTRSNLSEVSMAGANLTNANFTQRPGVLDCRSNMPKGFPNV